MNIRQLKIHTFCSFCKKITLLFVESNNDCIPHNSGQEETQEDEKADPPKHAFPTFDPEVSKDDDAEEESDSRTADVRRVADLRGDVHVPIVDGHAEVDPDQE